MVVSKCVGPCRSHAVRLVVTLTPNVSPFVMMRRRQLFERIIATETDTRVGGSVQRGKKWLCKWFDDVAYSVRTGGAPIALL